MNNKLNNTNNKFGRVLAEITRLWDTKWASITKMTATGYSETLAFIYQITRRHIPEDSNLKFLTISFITVKHNNPYKGKLYNQLIYTMLLIDN
jgi:hypothetical protein